MVFIWLLVLALASTKQVIMTMYEIDPYNYFCLSFLTSTPTQLITFLTHTLLVVVKIVLCMICICCYAFLLVYTLQQQKQINLQSIKRNTVLHKCAARMALLTVSTLFTWIPMLLIQLLILCNVQIPTDVLLWMVLFSLPINLTLDPILILKSYIWWQFYFLILLVVVLVSAYCIVCKWF